MRGTRERLPSLRQSKAADCSGRVAAKACNIFPLYGTHLVLADGAKMTTLDAADLSKVAEGNLVEPCASAVLLSAHRFICGPAFLFELTKPRCEHCNDDARK